MRRLIHLTLVLTLTMCTVLWGYVQTSPLRPTVKETCIGKNLPPAYINWQFFISPNVRRVAYIAMVDPRTLACQLYVDGVPTKVSEGVSDVTFSPDGKRLAYSVLRKGVWCLVVDGVESTTGRLYKLAFSPDSRRLAYIFRQDSDTGGQLFVERQAHSGRVQDVFFSPDSRRLAYIATAPDGNTLVLDGQEGKKYGPITAGRDIFSPDSRHVMYVAKVLGHYDQCLVVLDGVEGKIFNRISAAFYTQDGSGHYYVARRGDKTVIVVNGQESPEYASVWSSSVSPDGKRLAVLIRQNNMATLVIDGRSYGPYDQASQVLFSPDSRHFVYVAGDNQKSSLYVDGTAVGQPADSIGWPLVYSPDGKRLAYLIKQNNTFSIMCDGTASPAYEAIVMNERNSSRNFIFSPDGSKIAFVAKRGRQQLVVSGNTEQTPYDSIDPEYLSFSPDGRHLAYRAKQGKRILLVVDGQEVVEFTDIVGKPPIVWDSPTHLHTIGVRKDAIFCVDVDLGQ